MVGTAVLLAELELLLLPDPDDPLLLPDDPLLLPDDPLLLPDPLLPDPDPLPLPDPDPLPLPEPDPLPLPDPDPLPLPPWNSRAPTDTAALPPPDPLPLPDPDPLPLPDPDPLPLPDPEPLPLPLPDPDPLPLPEPDPLPLPDPDPLPVPVPDVLLLDAGALATASVALSMTETVLPLRLKTMVRERSGETAIRPGCDEAPAKRTVDVESLLLIAFTMFRTGVLIPALGNKAFETKARNLRPLSLCCVAVLEDFFPPQEITPPPRTTSTAKLVRALFRGRTPKGYQGQNI
jgi:hypothetical protein